MADLLRSINMVRRNLNHDLKIEGVLITMTNERTNLSKKITHEVRENLEGILRYLIQQFQDVQRQQKVQE